VLPGLEHAASVYTRLDCYETTTLPSRQLGVAKHMLNHAMEHLHWMADFITKYRWLVTREELFYEQGTDHSLSAVDIARQVELNALRTGQPVPVVRGLSASEEPPLICQVSTAVTS
jgi:hypothetical protein